MRPGSSKSAAASYATRDNIVFPGTAAEAAVLETVAQRDLTGQLGTDGGTYASLTTALTGTNNDFVVFARTPGTAGNGIDVIIVDSANNNEPLAVAYETNTLTITAATNGSSAITSTAAQVVAAINDSAAASAAVYAELAPSNDGTGVVTALSSTTLKGGSATNPSTDVVSQTLSITV